MDDPPSSPKKSLIMAGGGLKVAFQAGVLQVWLDEAQLEFDHADGASGGTFNLAMYCQGMSGTEIADNWRNLPILRGLNPNWLQYLKLFYASSLLNYKRWRKNILRGYWKLDWQKIRARNRNASFNLYNFSKHRAEIWDPAAMSEDALVSCVSLPMWFPPVRLHGDDYIDPVYYTDANLLEAINRGADELWIIWTVSEQPRWRHGFIHNYFQIIEVAGNGRLKDDIRRIEASNDAIASGEPGEFGRSIAIRMLKAEVPLHYLINFRSSRFSNAVDLGVEMAREWCKSNSIPLHGTSTDTRRKPVYLEFTETMKGHVTEGLNSFVAGLQDPGRIPLSVTLVISTNDLEQFLLQPDHQGSAAGTISCDAYGGKRDIEKGLFNLFVDADRADTKQMRYRLFFRDESGRALTLTGYKQIHNDPGFDVWNDTTMLYTRVLDGHITEIDQMQVQILAAGVIRIHLMDFIKQMLTFRVCGSTFLNRMTALPKFGIFFIRSLWRGFKKQPSST